MLWKTDFGGRFSRLRDAEVADVLGDGVPTVVVGTHDQGVVALVRPDGKGGFAAKELDRQPDTFVHEIEVGDLDGDGVLEIYATPSRPNKLDGTPQPGSVVRYVPARGEGRTVVRRPRRPPRQGDPGRRTSTATARTSSTSPWRR